MNAPLSEKEVKPSTKNALIEVLPPAPKYFPDQIAIDMWEEMGAILIADGDLTKKVLYGLALLCVMHSQIEGLMRKQRKPTMQMIATYRSLLNDFGMTPAAAKSLAGKKDAPPKKEEPVNPFSTVGAASRR